MKITKYIIGLGIMAGTVISLPSCTDLQKKLAGADHTYQLSRLQSAYDSISSGNDGKGNISVYRLFRSI